MSVVNTLDKRVKTSLTNVLLESGMDVKTLSANIGYVSAKTTLNTYTHVTDAMRQTAAAKINRGIGKCEPPVGAGASD